MGGSWARWAAWLCVAWVLVVAGVAGAAPEDRQASDHALVPPPVRPTEVSLALYLLGVSEVSEPKDPFPFFVGEVFLESLWHDPRLAFDAEALGRPKISVEGEAVERLLEGMWSPGFVLENQDRARVIEEREVTIYPDGNVRYEERFSARLRVSMDLRTFPFDAQTFEILVASQLWNETYMTITPSLERTGFDPAHKTLEWTVSSVALTESRVKKVRSKSAFSEARLAIAVDREPGYYVWKLIAPLMIIALLSWSTFWMTGEPAPTRMQRSFIAVLSVVAFHRVVADSQPRIPYLSFIDGVVYLVFLLCGLTIFQIVLTHVADRKGRKDIAEKLDYHARWGFPALLVGTFGVMWWAAH